MITEHPTTHNPTEKEITHPALHQVAHVLNPRPLVPLAPLIGVDPARVFVGLGELDRLRQERVEERIVNVSPLDVGVAVELGSGEAEPPAPQQDLLAVEPASLERADRPARVCTKGRREAGGGDRWVRVSMGTSDGPVR